jgi:hypothetical protein
METPEKMTGSIQNPGGAMSESCNLAELTLYRKTESRINASSAQFRDMVIHPEETLA